MSCSIELSNNIPFCTFFFSFLPLLNLLHGPFGLASTTKSWGCIDMVLLWLVDDVLWEGFGPETSEGFGADIFVSIFLDIFCLCKPQKSANIHDATPQQQRQQKGGTVRKIHLIHLSTNQATAMTANRQRCDFRRQKVGNMLFFTPMTHRDRVQSNPIECVCVVLGVENLELPRCPGFS